jgi:hypothetical protein
VKRTSTLHKSIVVTSGFFAHVACRSAADVRDGEKGPLVIEVLKRRVQARTAKRGTGSET